jgi:hypothetical protein
MNDPKLEELREAMSKLVAPRAVEAAVMAEFRTRRQRRSSRIVWVWCAAAAVAAVVLAVTLLPWPGASQPEPVIVVQQPTPAPAPTVITPAPTLPPQVRPVRRSKPTPRPKPAPPAEIASDFIALPYAPPLYADEGGQVVRVQLPRSAMRSVGLPVLEERAFERVPADVLLGQDGIARAVRFVSVAH